MSLRLVLLRALALCSIVHAAGVGAQLTGTLTAVSDYRFRGISLSQQKPAAQLSLTYDDPGGWYGGLFGSTVKLAGESATSGQGVAFLGYVAPMGGELHWEAGVDYSAFSAERDYDYGEIYAGIISRNFSARVHYSPDYFGLAQGSFYCEVNATHPLRDGFVLLGHVGVLVPVGHGEYTGYASVRNPVDARAGVGFELAGLNVQVAWVGTNGVANFYAIAGAQRRNTVVVSVALPF